MIESRLAQLSPPARELARLGAAIGRGFGLDLLLEAGQSTEDAVVRALDELWQRRIVREIGTNQYDFTHDKLREVAYAEIGPPQRRFLHRRIAQALEALHAGALDPLSGADRRASRPRRAWTRRRSSSTSARQLVAQRIYANEDAIDLLRRALALLERQPADRSRETRELQIQLGAGAALPDDPRLDLAGGGAQPGPRGGLCDTVGDDAQRARALYGMQSLYLVQARLEKVELVSEELHQLYQRTQQSPPPLESEMMLTGARLHLGRITEASERVRARAGAERSHRRSSGIADEQGWNFAVHGARLVGARAVAPGPGGRRAAQGLEAVRLADDLAQPFNQSVAATYLALLQQLRGDAATARRYAEQALSVTTESRAPYYRAWSEILVRHAEATSRPDAETIAALRAAIEVFRASGAPTPTAVLPRAPGRGVPPGRARGGGAGGHRRGAGRGAQQQRALVGRRAAPAPRRPPARRGRGRRRCRSGLSARAWRSPGPWGRARSSCAPRPAWPACDAALHRWRS